ncbi:3'(2'),5'-bisphosphate nucleotidase CysQ [Salegentibacter mishustinae]|uniref:3'(2'),5'-bisphosphate nucleotidase CysQ n=1 Tax=Salegentibacter mishustinae TaxID=270918 RepID=A0A0Q9Z8U0_9FLAO|nr:3'(2'),5'-bisphosphate nucleotidase CysQ [Salegentibacter mishustinae]KRG29375.1 3'(2'),5'-bisphosphate nucleotidase CysQ [Salegentibacter mishustinae]PNW22732.1 3'(2'),5'-bisphosphate nucleotidase CysQ [Salegentibacter mishustinae]
MKEIYKIAIRAAVEAGIRIMEIYENEDFQVESKFDDSPLTIADNQANDIINSFLIPTGVPIISEENKQLDFSDRKDWQECWIVDPLDGTKEFIKRNGEFTVNIALIRNNIPVFGVIYVPAKKDLYIGDVENHKSFKTTLNSVENMDVENLDLIEISPSEFNDKIRVVGSRSHMNQDTLDYIDELKSKFNKDVEIVSKGSSLKFCLVAEGKADVYPRFAPTMEWDTAAGQAICNAVGLSVIDSQTDEPMKYNRENLLNNYFLVSRLG